MASFTGKLASSAIAVKRLNAAVSASSVTTAIGSDIANTTFKSRVAEVLNNTKLVGASK